MTFKENVEQARLIVDKMAYYFKPALIEDQAFKELLIVELASQLMNFETTVVQEYIDKFERITANNLADKDEQSETTSR